MRDASLPALRLRPVQRRLTGRMSPTIGYPDGLLTRTGGVDDGLPPGRVLLDSYGQERAGGGASARLHENWSASGRLLFLA